MNVRVPCGRNEGHGETCVAGALCAQCAEINRLRAELAACRDGRVRLKMDELRAERDAFDQKINGLLTMNGRLIAELADCQMQLDASCNAEELRQVRAELAACRKLLREILDAIELPSTIEMYRRFGDGLKQRLIDAARKEGK